MSILISGKRVTYSTSSSSTKEGLCIGCVLMRENKEAPVISGYAVVHDDGTIEHIAYWKLKSVKLKDSNTSNNTAHIQGEQKKKDDYPF